MEFFFDAGFQHGRGGNDVIFATDTDIFHHTTRTDGLDGLIQSNAVTVASVRPIVVITDAVTSASRQLAATIGSRSGTLGTGASAGSTTGRVRSTRRRQGRAGLLARHRTARAGGTPSSRLGSRAAAAASVHSLAGTTIAAIIGASAAAATSIGRAVPAVATVQASTASVILAATTVDHQPVAVAVLQVTMAVAAAVVAKAVVKAAAAAVIAAVVEATVAIVVLSAAATVAPALVFSATAVAAAVVYGSRPTALLSRATTASCGCVWSRRFARRGASNTHVFLGAPTLLTIGLTLGTAGAGSYALAMRSPTIAVAVGDLTRIHFVTGPVAFVFHVY